MPEPCKAQYLQYELDRQLDRITWRKSIMGKCCLMVDMRRFKKVAEVLDTTNLMIKIEIRTDLLSPYVTYEVRLVFKFCDLRKVSSKPTFQHAIVEMRQSMLKALNFEHFTMQETEQKNDIQQVKELDMNVDQVQQFLTYEEGEKLFSLTEVNGKTHLMLPAKAALHDFTNDKLFTSKSSAESRIPRQRTDGLMEVEVWKFNSTHDLKNNCLPMSLRLTSYEGTMSGLIVCGLEFRPV
ncbi:kinase-like domain, phloem protein 2-like protein [Tanacetum coccineum]